MKTEDNTLRRTLTFRHAVLSGIGVILGAGVYALVGPASGMTGNGLWLAFTLAGVIAGLTAYSYTRFIVLRPKDSPEFQYTSMAFGPRVGFLAGWLMLAADLLAAATVALGFGGYLQHLIGTPTIVNAALLLAVLAVLLYTGIGESVTMAIVLTIVEAAGLLFIIAIGVPSWPTVDFLDIPQGASGVWAAVALIFFAYLGFDEMGNFAEEMKNPERDIPRALFVSLTIATAIYALVGLSTISTTGWRDLSASEAPLALAAGKVLGPSADMILSMVALAATANTVLLLLVSGSRSVYGMASAGVLPKALGKVGHRGIPKTATAAVLVIVVATLLAGSLEQVAAMSNATILASFALTNASLPRIAMQGQLPGNRIRRSADIILPVLAVITCGGLFVYTGWASIVVTVTLAIIGLVLNKVFFNPAAAAIAR